MIIIITTTVEGKRKEACRCYSKCIYLPQIWVQTRLSLGNEKLAKDNWNTHWDWCWKTSIDMAGDDKSATAFSADAASVQQQQVEKSFKAVPHEPSQLEKGWTLKGRIYSQAVCVKLWFSPPIFWKFCYTCALKRSKWTNPFLPPQTFISLL